MSSILMRCIALSLFFLGLINASATPLTEIFNYQSTLTSDADGPLDLKAELNYDDAHSAAPIAVVMHEYSGTTGKTAGVRANAQRLRDYGFFAISVAMRGRDGSDGTRDSGGLEIYDIYDAVEAVKAAFPALVNPEIVYLTGYSGGGGNTMSALTKFPDYFNAGAAFFGMSDYGYDVTNGWYFYGADSRTSQLDTDIGNPSPPADSAVTDRYHARASNLASVNNPYSEIHIFVNDNETICPPVNSLTYYSNATNQESFAGEFTNITVHIGNSALYEDFNHNSINDSNEQQYWPHGTLSADRQYSAEHWFMDRLLAGQIPKPVLNPEDSLFVAGFVKTARFTCFVGDGQEGAVQLDYNLTSTNLTFRTTVLSLNTHLTSSLMVDTQAFTGRMLEALTNGISLGTFAGGSDWTTASLADGDVLELRDAGPAIIWWDTENTSSITPTSAVVNATLNGDPADVWLYYGTSSKGPQKAGWAFTNFIGSSVATGVVSSALADLSSGKSYSYVFYATNVTQQAEAWSAVATFTTEKAALPPVPQSPLLIDFNDNDSGARPVQDGYTEIIGSGGTVTNGYGVGALVTIELTASSLDDRDRGALTGGPGLDQSDLLRDFIFRNAGTGLGITLTTLQAGEYTFTGFFHDNTVQQGEGKLGVDTGDGQGEVLKVASFTYSTGAAPAEIGTAGFSFAADGIHPVTIYLRDTAGTAPFVINGFVLEKIEPPDVIDNLVAYYKFEENLLDSSGNENHGAAGGSGISFSTSTPAVLLHSADCADFDGSGFVTLPYLGLYNNLVTSNGLTISLWIKGENSAANSWFLSEGYTGSSSPAYAFGHVSGTGCPHAYIRSNSNNTIVDREADSSATPSAAFDGEWHHWAWTDNNGVSKMYIDGVFVPSDEASGEWNYTRGTLTLDTTTIGAIIRGPTDSKYPFTGQIDDVSVWSTTLRNEDILALASGVPPETISEGFDHKLQGTAIMVQ